MIVLNTIEGTSAGDPLPVTLIEMAGQVSIPAGSAINEFSSLTVPAFWSAVRFLSETVASFRRAVHLEQGRSRAEVPDHPVNTLLRRRISDVSSPYRTIETWLCHAIVWGNGYLWIKRDARGRPVALLNLNPEICTPFIFNGLKYIYVALKTPVVLDDADVLHIAGLGFDGVRGFPIVQMLRQAIQTNKVAETFTLEYLSKGTFVRGAIEVPGTLTPEQFEQMRKSIADYRSSDGANRFQAMILPGGAHLNNSTVPNQTSQLIETRKLSDITICQILRVSPHIIYQLDSQKLSTVQQLGAEIRTYSLGPWITKIESECNSKLFTPAEQDAGYFVRLHSDSLLEGDQGTLSRQLLAEVAAGVRTVNEARSSLELEPVGPEGDVLRVPFDYPGTTDPLANESADGPTAPPAEDDTSGDADQPAPPAETDVDPDNDPEAHPASYNAVLAPLIASAVDRISTKTAKAFASKADTTGDARIRWVNIFSDTQARMVREVLAPVADAATALGRTIAVDRVADRYAQAIRRQAATGEPADLHLILTTTTEGSDHE